jgi:VWFA-related protein
MKGFSQVGFLIICSLFFTTAFGQRATSSPNPQPTPPVEDSSVVKITTTLIQIDATVLDKKGKPVTGLTADDFEIYENNKKQQITNFSFVELEPDKSTAAVALPVKPSKNSIPIPPVPTRLRPEQVRRTVALVVDDLGLSFPSVNPVRSALKKFVDQQMQPGDLVAIIRTGSGAGALQQFTSDKRMLYAAIERIRWNPNGRGGINVFQPIDPSDVGATLITSQTGGQGKGIDETLSSNRRFDDYREDIFAVGTLGAVNYVVKGMHELPGRKAVVLFSDGFGLYDLDQGLKKPNPRLIDNLRRLTELANRSSVIIYTMDARGIVNPLIDAQDNTEEFNQDPTLFNQNTVIEQSIMSRSTELYESQQGLRALAEQTGGFAIINNNNLSKGLERVLNDQKGYYLLGYQPDSETFDPKKARFNKLTVKLKRPELRVRYRSGFFGIKEDAISYAPKTPRQQILAALTSPLSSGDIDLRLTSLFANDAATGTFMRSLVYVDGNGLKFNEEADGWQKATFDIVAMIFGDNGTIVDEVSRTETIKARADTLQEIREKGFVATITVPIRKPGGYQMRVVLRDTATSRIGSSNQFIEVPNLKKNRLTLSGILLQRLEPQIGDNKSTVSQKQFQSDEQRDVAMRRFRAGMPVRFGYAIYNAKLDKAVQSPKLTMQFKIFHDGKETFISKEKPAKLLEQTDSQRLLTEGRFTLGRAIPAGDYVLQIIVKDLSVKERNQVATQWIDFEVIP